MADGDGAAQGGGAAAGGPQGGGQQQQPWHAGIDAEILGHWQNKGWKVDDPKEIALNATRQAREAEKHFGVPADQLLKMPKADAKPEDLKAFWGRLGAADAKDYDFSTVKFNGEPLQDALVSTMRDAMAQAYVPKDRAPAIVAAVVKYLENTDKAAADIATAKLVEEKAKLDKNWGVNKDFNHLKAMEGARRLGITPEAVKALEGQIGYAAVMEAMRKIGAGTSEDTFVERGTTGTGTPTTREGAQARLNELMADPAWGKRLTAGDAAATNEWRALLTQIDGVAA